MDPKTQPIPPHSSRPAALVAAAANWVEKRDHGLTPAERHELQAWLKADRRHAAAFAKADTTRTEFDWPLHAGTVDAVLTGLATRARTRRTRRKTAAAACVAATLMLTMALGWRTRAFQQSSSEAGRSSLVVLVPQRQTLPDGSVVELKDDAKIQFDFSGASRLVTLARGTAHFQVAKNPARPFVVTAGGVTAHAVGTAFVVELNAQSVSVLVTEGRVAVNKTPAAPVMPLAPSAAPVSDSIAVLDVGKSVSIPIAETTTSLPVVHALPEIEVEEKLSWRIPRLEFSGTPLKEVIKRINRHNRLQFIIADSSLEDLALSGILRADKTDALVKMLESEFQVRAERKNEQIILRKSR